jgi:hypothetical protein
MPHGGRHGHTLRQLRRRIDEVLEEGRERRRPIPPPISEEHAALRERIIEELRAIEWDYSTAADTWYGDPLPTPETLHHSIEAMVLMRKEHEFLTDQGVDPRPYERYERKF